MLKDGRWIGPILDQHMHLDRSNRFLDAVEEFVRVGGTAINLVHKPNFENLPIDIDEYRAAYLDTLVMADEVRAKFGIQVSVILGPHPVAWAHQVLTIGMTKASDLHLQAVDLALELYSSGDCVCLGEIGRPHYPVSEEIWDAANELLVEVLSRAAKVGASVQLHVEDNGSTTYQELAEICGRAGMPLNRTIRHYAPSDVSAQFTNGLACTVSVGKGCIESLVSSIDESSSPWGMETDFLDDPRRPGAVLGPKTIPKRTQELCRALLEIGKTESEVSQIMMDIHSNWPTKLYS